LRALVVDPEILFLDEPFSALDYEMTLFMREQMQRIFVETANTTVLVSHDLEEAVYLSDRILLLSRHPARAVEFVHYDVGARPRTRQARCRKPTLSAPRRILPRNLPSVRCARDEQGMKRLQMFLAVRCASPCCWRSGH